MSYESFKNSLFRKVAAPGLAALAVLSSSQVASAHKFGGYVSGGVGLGQMENSDAELKSRWMSSASVDTLLGYQWNQYTFGVHLDYTVQGQLSSLSDAGGTNLKGSAPSAGLGLRYVFSPDYYAMAAIDLAGTYDLDKDTIAGENDDLRQPVGLRLKIGKFLNASSPYSVDLDARYVTYNKLHISGVDHSRPTTSWNLGVAFTYHFGELRFVSTPVAPTPVESLPVATTAPKIENVFAVKQNGDKFSFELGGDQSFAPNSFELNPEMKNKLVEAAKALAAQPDIRIKILGHTDTSGNARKNTKLSADRANAVKTVLVENGLTADRIEAKGLGSAQPISENKTKEGRAKNRRVEISFEKSPSTSKDSE